MARSTPSAISVVHPVSRQSTDATVVSLRGEHDIATKVSLVVAITQAAKRDGTDVLVDLSGVTFMDASTLGALVGCRNRLRSFAQLLELRAPSTSAVRVLELCGLTHLLQAGEPARSVDPNPVTSSQGRAAGDVEARRGGP